MTKLRGLVGSWVCAVTLGGAWVGCTPRTDIGVGPDEGSGGEGLSSPQAGAGGSPTDGEGGSPEGGSSGSAGSSAANGGDSGGGNGGTTSSGGASGTSGTGGDSGSTGTGGTSGSAGTGGTSGTGGSGSWGDGELLCGALGNLDASSGLMLDLGLTEAIEWFERTDDRLLATDYRGNWALWDLNDKSVLARGRAAERVGMDCPGCPRADLAGDLFTLVSSTRLEVRSLLDGSLITTIATPGEQILGTAIYANQGGLSPDGSYYWSGTADGIKAWDDSGTLLLTQNGDYRTGINVNEVSAAPDELRIAAGPAGRGAIERISIDTGASTTSPFEGTFSDWFLDGGRFVTYQSGARRLYNADTTTQEALFADVGFIGGQGDYFWNAASGELWIYAVANPSSPVAKYPVSGQDPYNYPYGRYHAVGNRIGLIHETKVTVVELDPTGITDSTVDLPAAPAQWWTYTADAAGNYALANSGGVIYDGADRDHALSCGELYDLAGSEQGTLAVATSVGLMLFELTPDSRRYIARIPFPSAEVSLSSDGGVLAATSLYARQVDALAIWSLPDRTQILTRPYPPTTYGLSVSALGNRFSYATLGSGVDYNRYVEDLAGNVSMTLTGDPLTTGIQLSPDGSRVAVRHGRRPNNHYSTQLYDNGALIDTFDGAPVLWLDQNRLLVNPKSGNNPDFQRGARIYAIPGGFQPGPQLDLFSEDDEEDAAMLSPTEIYSGHLNRVYSLSTGELLWSGPPADRGAVASDNIVYAIGSQIMISAY